MTLPFCGNIKAEKESHTTVLYKKYVTSRVLLCLDPILLLGKKWRDGVWDYTQIKAGWLPSPDLQM